MHDHGSMSACISISACLSARSCSCVGIGTCDKNKVAQASVRLRPAGSPEAPVSTKACLRLPQAPASLGQPATWAALTGHVGRVLDKSRHSEVAASGFSATAAAAQAYDSRRWVNSFVFEAWQLPQKRQAFMPSPVERRRDGGVDV